MNPECPKTTEDNVTFRLSGAPYEYDDPSARNDCVVDTCTSSARLIPMSSVPPPTFPTLNPTTSIVGQPSGTTIPAMDPNSLNLMAGIANVNPDDVSSASPMSIDPRGNGPLSFPSRTTDSGYPPLYPPFYAHHPMGPLPFPSNAPFGPYMNTPNAQHTNVTQSRIESISDLVALDPLEFEYSTELNAVLHAGKCQECVQFGMHIIMPGNYAKFLRTTKAHSEADVAPLRSEIEKLTSNARIAAKATSELKVALQRSEQAAASLKEQLDKCRQEHDEILMEHRTLSQRFHSLEQQYAAATYQAPTRPMRNYSPPRSSSRASTPYARPTTHRSIQAPSRRPRSSVPTLLEPESEGDVAMDPIPAGDHPCRMHPDQPPYFHQPRCAAVNFLWKDDHGVKIQGLPKTRAGTYYFPSKVGSAWFQFEHGAKTIDEVHRRIRLLFRNRKEESWAAASRSIYELRQYITSLPEVMDHFLHLSDLRKSVWTVINDGIANGSDLSITSPGCRLHANGYAGLYTPDIELWAVIHASTNVSSKRLTARAGRTTTTVDLKKMFKDAICSSNFFEIEPSELATGQYQLPRLAHYNGPVDMSSIADWLRNTIGMTPYMVHAHFRPFLRRAHDATRTPGDHHHEFSPDHLQPDESLVPPSDDSLVDFPEGRVWTPNRGPRGRFTIPHHQSTDEPLANAPSGPPVDSTTVITTPEDTDMADSGVAHANATLVTPH